MVEEQFIDAEQHTSKDIFSFRDLIMRHLARITQISSKEFRSGYWNRKPISPNSNVTMDFYVEDTRDSYINSIDVLNDLLLPHFDKQMEKIEKELKVEENEELEKIRKSEKGTHDKWINKKLLIKRKLFQQLSLLLRRLKYLEGKQFTQ